MADKKTEDAETAPVSAKDAIYIQIGDFVKEKTGKRIGKTGGREIFDRCVEQIFTAAVREGSFRFNGGFGSFHVKTYQAGTRRLPSGQQTTFGERQKVRYEEGVVVKALIVEGGDLEAALKTRGSRAKAPKAKAEEPAPPDKGEDLDLD
ncbi:MAG TPA: hypothetical protein ENI27_00090 [bacterium]|nr:hypothetical protein [bacterium]